jgi:magnesium-transporting ATPase (P-type)
MNFLKDERTSLVSAKVSQVILVLTQTALLCIILYRGYALNQPDDQILDLRILLALSVFGNIFATLLFSGNFPRLSAKALFLTYLALVVLLFAVLSIWLGLPNLDEWQLTILPVLVGPAILVGLYWLAVKFGEERLNR